MRGILIDPYERRIIPVETDGSLVAMHDAIGSVVVTSMLLGPGELCWVDDEGYLKAGIPTFQLEGHRLANAGRGLILGVRQDGDNRSTTLTLDFVKDHITFPEHETTGEMTPSRHVNEPVEIHGIKFDHALIGGDPIFRTRRNG